MGADILSTLTSPEITGPALVVAKGALSAVAGETAKKLWRKAKGSAESNALIEPVALAFVRAVEPARLEPCTEEMDWWTGSGERLLAPFTDPNVAEWVVAASLSSPEEPAVAQGTLLAALQHAGRDFVLLAADLGVEGETFLRVLPGTIRDEVIAAAYQTDSPLRDLAQLAILRQIAGRSQPHEIAALPAWELRDQVARLLDCERAWHERAVRDLPYLIGHPAPLSLDTAVGVRVGLRREISAATTSTNEIYQPVSGRGVAHVGDALSLNEAIARHARLVVLADPGMGKTWMMHTQAARIASSSRLRLGVAAPQVVPDDLIVQVAVRCENSRIPRTRRASEGSCCGVDGAAWVVTFVANMA